MHYNTLDHMYDEMLEHPDKLFIVSNSKHSALVSVKGSTFLIKGDFSGTPEECEAEARRIINNAQSRRRRG